MFNPNDIFISVGGTTKLLHLGFNLELYNNFSFRSALYINVVYNGERTLNEVPDINSLSYDNMVILTENNGNQYGALDIINASLKSFIESDRSVAVIHNFDYLFFYDNAFKMMITDLFKSEKSFLGWMGKKTHLLEKAICDTDCFVITKEFAKQMYPIDPKKDKSIFYRTAIHTEFNEHDWSETMEEWLHRRFVNVIMPEYLDELNNHKYPQKMPRQHIMRDHNKIIDKLDKYCFFILDEDQLLFERDGLQLTGDIHRARPAGCYREYDSKYHSIHTHHREILRPLLIMFKYNLNNKKFKTIDKFIENKIKLEE